MGRTAVQPETQRNAITLINSLICYPSHYEGVGFPDLLARRDLSSAEVPFSHSRYFID